MKKCFQNVFFIFCIMPLAQGQDYKSYITEKFALNLTPSDCYNQVDNVVSVLSAETLKIINNECSLTARDIDFLKRNRSVMFQSSAADDMLKAQTKCECLLNLPMMSQLTPEEKSKLNEAYKEKLLETMVGPYLRANHILFQMDMDSDQNAKWVSNTEVYQCLPGNYANATAVIGSSTNKEFHCSLDHQKIINEGIELYLKKHAPSLVTAGYGSAIENVGGASVEIAAKSLSDLGEDEFAKALRDEYKVNSSKMDVKAITAAMREQRQNDLEFNDDEIELFSKMIKSFKDGCLSNSDCKDFDGDAHKKLLSKIHFNTLLVGVKVKNEIEYLSHVMKSFDPASNHSLKFLFESILSQEDGLGAQQKKFDLSNKEQLKQAIHDVKALSSIDAISTCHTAMDTYLKSCHNLAQSGLLIPDLNNSDRNFDDIDLNFIKNALGYDTSQADAKYKQYLCIINQRQETPSKKTKIDFGSTFGTSYKKTYYEQRGTTSSSLSSLKSPLAKKMINTRRLVTSSGSGAQGARSVPNAQVPSSSYPSNSGAINNSGNNYAPSTNQYMPPYQPPRPVEEISDSSQRVDQRTSELERELEQLKSKLRSEKRKPQSDQSNSEIADLNSQIEELKNKLAVNKLEKQKVDLEQQLQEQKQGGSAASERQFSNNSSRTARASLAPTSGISPSAVPNTTAARTFSRGDSGSERTASSPVKTLSGRESGAKYKNDGQLEGLPAENVIRLKSIDNIFDAVIAESNIGKSLVVLIPGEKNIYIQYVRGDQGQIILDQNGEPKYELREYDPAKKSYKKITFNQYNAMRNKGHARAPASPESTSERSQWKKLKEILENGTKK